MARSDNGCQAENGMVVPSVERVQQTTPPAVKPIKVDEYRKRAQATAGTGVVNTSTLGGSWRQRRIAYKTYRATSSLRRDLKKP